MGHLRCLDLRTKEKEKEVKYFLVQYSGISIKDGSRMVGFSGFEYENYPIPVEMVRSALVKKTDLVGINIEKVAEFFSKTEFDEFVAESNKIKKQREFKKEPEKWVITH